MRRIAPASLVIAALLATAVAAAGQRDASPSARLEAIKKEVTDAEAAVERARARLPDPNQTSPELDALTEAFRAKLNASFNTAIEIAKADPASDAGFDALEWVLTYPMNYNEPVGKTALELTARHHAANPKVGEAIAVVAHYAPPFEHLPGHASAANLLRAVAEKNPNRTARGQAFRGLAMLAMSAYELAEYKNPDDRERRAAEAERVFETLLRDYGDCPSLRRQGRQALTATLGEDAERQLFALRHLRVGKVPPDIVGEDLDGVPFKLSDHRGKVVLLVFWASWCNPCMAAVPHEREIVRRYAGRPFVLIGVNGDPSRDVAVRTVARHSINWRSFWNGKEGAHGPIAAAWNVRAWPTVYVIDHQGVIRARDVQDKELDDVVERLVSAADPPDRR